MHTKHNSPPPGVEKGLVGEGKRHWSIPVILANIKHNSPPGVNSSFGGEGKRNWSLPVIYMHTKKTTHLVELIMD